MNPSLSYFKKPVLQSCYNHFIGTETYFRSVLIKYPDRGLVNGDSKLFSYLFWIFNFFYVFAPEANKIGIFLSRNQNVFANTYRLATFFFIKNLVFNTYF